MLEDRLKIKLGFGCMRLPMVGEDIDIPQFCRMVDTFLAAGGNYFDTARVYHGGSSETALRAALTTRHPRDSYFLADKLSDSCFRTEEDIRPFFASQLESLGVDYIDFYLMHAQNANNYKKYQATRAYETAAALKAEGKIRHVGLSFHDKPEVLDRILTDHPEMEFVQIQFNYLDYEDPGVQSRACYEVAAKHGKPMVIMEPVKGGRLVRLPEKAEKIYHALGTLSPASYAIRFAAGFPGVMMVLSGMSDMAQLEDNLSYMKDFRPLNEKELAAVADVTKILRAEDQIECTGCRYCVPGCPQKIAIPDLFAALNTTLADPASSAGREAYARATEEGSAPASACIKCGKCENICPQHLPVRRLLGRVKSVFE